MKYLLQEILFPATHFDKLDSIDDFIRKLHSLVSSLHNLFLEPVRGLGFEILIKLESLPNHSFAQSEIEVPLTDQHEHAGSCRYPNEAIHHDDTCDDLERCRET